MFTLLVLACLSFSSHAIRNTKVIREFDVKGNIMFATYTIDFQLEDTDKSSPTYLFGQEFDPIHLSTISFTLDGNIIYPKFSQDTNSYEITVPNAAENSHIYSLLIQGIYFDIARPFPKVIHQDEMQCIRFEGNLYLDSPYHSDVDEVYIIARSTNYLSTSPEITFQYDAETFLCRNKNIEPHTKKSFYIHYSSPAYFLGLTQNEREAIISHIAPSRIQERVNVRNTGPTFEGELNGFKNLVQRNTQAGIIREMTFNVPKTASDFAYRDEIGNISTSKLVDSATATQVIIEPRFPLYGGWKTSFYLEYYLPFSTLVSAADRTPSALTRTYADREFFFSDYPDEVAQRRALAPREFHAAIPLAPAMQHAATEEAVLRIALPEGAQDVVVSAPFDGVEKDSEEPITKSVMDYLGRRTIILRRRNMLSCPAFTDVIVQYNVPTLYRIHKPIILAACFLCIFALVLFARLLFRWFKAGPLEHPLPPNAVVAPKSHTQ